MPTKTAKNLSSQGKIIDYDEASQVGVIVGFDRSEYSFTISEWQNESKYKKPKANMIVNFEIKENEKTREAVRVRLR